MSGLREKMPAIAAFVDDLRHVIGREVIDQAIRDGLRNGTFRACEAGHEVGWIRDDARGDRAVRLSEMSPWSERTK